MIIDFHTHTFPDAIAPAAIAKMEKLLAVGGAPVKAKLNGTRAGLSESSVRGGVDLSVVVPVATSPKQTESINRFAIENNENTAQTRLLSFGAIHPDNADYRQVLSGLKAAGIKGIKLHPDYQETAFDDIRYLRILDCAFSLGLIVVTHAGPDPAYLHHVHCTVDSIVSVLEQLGPDRLVLAHMGGFWAWEEVEAKLVGRQVFFDTANCFEAEAKPLTEEAFVRMVHSHGADQILFGTDSPWTDQKASVDRIRRMIPDEKEQRMILGENAEKLLGL